jgi:hypothetical protein
MKELMGGDLSPQFVDGAALDAARAEREHTRTAFAAGAAGAWTNLGAGAPPTGFRTARLFTESPTPVRLRTILVHPSNADIVYVLTSGGGLWKNSKFPRPPS